MAFQLSDWNCLGTKIWAEEPRVLILVINSPATILLHIMSVPSELFPTVDKFADYNNRRQPICSTQTKAACGGNVLLMEVSGNCKRSLLEYIIKSS